VIGVVRSQRRAPPRRVSPLIGCADATPSGFLIAMNISKHEQRVLHALAQGGRIVHHRDNHGRIVAVDCFTREGYLLVDCTLALFQRLRRRGLIGSTGGGAYRATRLGRQSVRAQADNR